MLDLIFLTFILEIGPTAGGECSKRWVLVRFIIEVLG